MTSIFLSPNKDDLMPREIMNIIPEAIEDCTFFYSYTLEKFGSCDQACVIGFRTNTKLEAEKCTRVLKHTGRYMAIVKSSSNYFVKFDTIPVIKVGERIVKEVNKE